MFRRLSHIFWLPFLSLHLFSQSFSLVLKPSHQNDEVLAEFMDMKGFNHFAFDLSADKPVYVNLFIEEYLKDSLVKQYDLFSDTIAVPRKYFAMTFPKTFGKHFGIRVYSLAHGDSLLELRLRNGNMAIYKNIKVNGKRYDYEWKDAYFDESNRPKKIKLKERFPLLYYTTTLEETNSGKTIQKYCEVSGVLDEKRALKQPTGVSHYFVIGLQLVENL